MNLSAIRERIATKNGRKCPVCENPADHFGPTVELPANDQDALVCRTDQYSYVHLLEAPS